jgi:DNA-binding transcriptional LysR family regulator
MDRLDALAAFVAVADKGGFAAAARHLRLSPPAVTRAIAGLERRLGTPLFMRTTRSVRLTDEGAAYLARCRPALADLAEAERVVMGTRSEPRGTLVITAPVVFGRLHVVPVIAALLRKHRRLAVRLLLIDRVVHLVEEGIDVAVRIGALADSALRAVRIGEVRRICVASPAYLRAHGTPAAAADLRRHAVLAFAGIDASDEWRFGADGKTVVKVEPRLSVNGADAVIAAAVQGLGVTRVLSYQVRAEIAAGRLRRVLDDEAPPPVPIHLVFQANRAGAPTVRAFIEHAKAYFLKAGL